MITAILLIFWAYWLTALFRLQLTSRYHRRLLNAVHDLAMNDIDSGRPWEWRYDALRAVPFYPMVWMVWRRFDSFIPDNRFLQPGAEMIRTVP